MTYFGHPKRAVWVAAIAAAVGVALMVVAMISWLAVNRVSTREARHFEEALSAAAAARHNIAISTAEIAKRLCVAVETSREINNRDRRTIQRGVAATIELRNNLRRTHQKIPGYDPDAAVVRARAELAARPYLPPLPCERLVKKARRGT